MKDMHTLSDRELVREAQRGSPDAFAVLYERYLPVVYNRVRYRIPESDVEDVTQEIFISAMKSLRSFKGEAKFSTWLRTLTGRRIADYYRSPRVEKVDLESAMVNGDRPTSENLTRPSEAPEIEDRVLLQRALAALPDHYVEIILLRFAEGLQFSEIADVRKQSLEATKSLFRRAIVALREQVGVMSDA
nr:sigma-70 family RNA polymerase sigma factor [Anaerolineae bacterium]